MDRVPRIDTPDAFDAICELVARDGRGNRLLGESISRVRPALQRVLIEGVFPYIYLEFPLMGAPACDAIAAYQRIPEDSRFASSGNIELQTVLDWFAGAYDGEGGDLWIELDTSKGMPDQAGVYLQHRNRTDLVPGFLHAVGKSDRLQAHRNLLRRAPDGWRFSYVGSFPHRAGDPLRVGAYLSHNECQRCAQDPDRIVDAFDHLGFSAYDGELVSRAAKMLGVAPDAEVQLDLMPDGGVGDTVGLSVSFNRVNPRDSRTCMEEGFGWELMQAFEEWGIADARWREIAGATYAKHFPYVRDDGEQGRFALLVMLCYAKAKFKACNPLPAKFYLACKAGDLDDNGEGVVTRWNPPQRV